METHSCVIIKRRGRREPYDERKVYASVYAACLNSHLEKTEAEKIAEKVARELSSWVNAKSELSSEEIFRKVIELLATQNSDAAFMYETHRDIA